MTKLENALIWLYVKTWGKFGEHVIGEKDLWNFANSDLDTAIMDLTYPRKRKINEKEKSERVQALNELVMEKFEGGGLAAFRQWSFEIHDQVIVTLPETVSNDSVNQQVTKILNWDRYENWDCEKSEFLKQNGIFFLTR